MNRRWWLACLVAAIGCGGDDLPTGPDQPAAAKLFGQAGQELTPNVVVPAARFLVAEIRFYRADGSEIVGLEADYSTLPRFEPASLVSVGAIPGEKFKFELTGRSSGGTGTMRIGLGRGSNSSSKQFGPFGVTVR